MIKASFKTLEALADFVEDRFGSAASLEKEIDALRHMRKMRTENYARFGARILSAAQAVVDKIKQATDQGVVKGQVVLAETIALKTFRNGISDTRIDCRLGSPKNLVEAISKVAALEKEIYEDESPTRLDIKIEESINVAPFKIRRCQNCGGEGHEFLDCGDNQCIYCSDTTHKSNNCNVVPDDFKFKLICKNCNARGHTISFCTSAYGDYCQICQMKHEAKNCGAKIVKYCRRCNNIAHQRDEECPRIATIEQQQQVNQQRQGNQ